jgi:hypothetical protein
MSSTMRTLIWSAMVLVLVVLRLVAEPAPQARDSLG